MATLLALDIASGGVSAGLFDSTLKLHKFYEVEWRFVGGPTLRTLSSARLLEAVGAAIRGATDVSNPPDALVLSSMMHTLLVTDANGEARTPVFTWFDRRDERVPARFRESFGSDYFLRTGAYFHPSFPSWKLADLRWNSPDVLAGRIRVGSAKSYVQGKLTGNFAEDFSSASASGLLNLQSCDWDAQTLGALELHSSALPALIPPDAVAGKLSAPVATWLGLKPDLPVVTGGGDGFLASFGSGCDVPDRVAVTLGTTAGVRRFSPTAEANSGQGMFCYRFDSKAFLVGCASNSGGNILSWAREAFGPFDRESVEVSGPSPPLFRPFLYGERSPFWDARRGPRFVGLTDRHSPRDLFRAVVEGVAFHLACYTELVTSGMEEGPPTLVLSGNGFRLPALARVLRTVTSLQVRAPDSLGVATLRGAVRCGFQALGVSTTRSVEALLEGAEEIVPQMDADLEARFDAFKELYYAPF